MFQIKIQTFKLNHISKFHQLRVNLVKRIFSVQFSKNNKLIIKLSHYCHIFEIWSYLLFYRILLLRLCMRTPGLVYFSIYFSNKDFPLFICFSLHNSRFGIDVIMGNNVWTSKKVKII